MTMNQSFNMLRWLSLSTINAKDTLLISYTINGQVSLRSGRQELS